MKEEKFEYDMEGKILPALSAKLSMNMKKIPNRKKMDSFICVVIFLLPFFFSCCLQ